MCASNSALAQEESKGVEVVNDRALDTIVVTAARVEKPISAIPNTVKVLDKDTIDQQLSVSTSLLDSLSFSIPSLTPARQKLTSSGVTLRGRTPLYLVDGIPQSTPLRNGERSGFTIDPAFVDRVEVIYGANAIQGVGATGGVINTVTVSAPESGETLLRLISNISTDDFEENGFHYRMAGLAGKSFGAADGVIGVAFDKRGLYYDGDDNAVAIDPTQGDLADSLSGNIFSKFGYNLDSDKRLEFSGNFFKLEGDGDFVRIAGDRAAGIPATSQKGEPAGDPTYNEALNLALSYTDADLAGGKLSLAGYYYDFYALYGGDTFPVFQDTTIAPDGTLFDQSALVSEKYGAKLTYVRQDTFWPGLQIAIGGDYLHDETYQELAQTGRIWVPKMQFEGYAPFLQLEQTLLDQKIRLSGGLRWENVTLTVPDFTTIASANSTFVDGGEPSFDKLLGNVGVVFEPVTGLTVFSSFAQGFTMPDAGLILRAVNTSGQSVDSLVDLQPVVADNIEIGAAFRRNGWDLAASYFWSNSDLGSRIQVVNGAGQIRRERTEISGFELSGSFRFDSGIKLGGNYAMLEGEYDSDGDGEVDRDLDGRNISPDRLNAYIEGPVIDKLWSRLQSSTFFDRDFKGGLPEHNFEGHTLVDLLFSYQSDKAGQFTLSFQNLFDKQYLTYYSQTVTFVNDTTFVSGRGRAISLGWNYDF
tara:strand:- start:13579 stop:15678 length:2100 start_codon:yes stop_codon:yes gene_type:complete